MLLPDTVFHEDAFCIDHNDICYKMHQLFADRNMWIILISLFMNPY